jgi:hypothetical protein
MLPRYRVTSSRRKKLAKSALLRREDERAKGVSRIGDTARAIGLEGREVVMASAGKFAPLSNQRRQIGVEALVGATVVRGERDLRARAPPPHRMLWVLRCLR